jgi:electron transfer flavoprotein beta subunit
MAPPPERAAGRVVEGEPEDAAREVVKLLREEAKVI